MDSGQLSFCLSWPMQDAGSRGANKSEEVKVTLTQKFTAVHWRFFRGSVALNETVHVIICKCSILYLHWLSLWAYSFIWITSRRIFYINMRYHRKGKAAAFVHILFLTTCHTLTVFYFCVQLFSGVNELKTSIAGVSTRWAVTLWFGTRTFLLRGDTVLSSTCCNKGCGLSSTHRKGENWSLITRNSQNNIPCYYRCTSHWLYLANQHFRNGKNPPWNGI